MARTKTNAHEPSSPREMRQNGPAIRAFRQLLGLTVDDLAHAIQMSAPTLRNYENEHRSCPPEVLANIAAKLQIDVRAITRRQVFGSTERAA